MQLQSSVFGPLDQSVTTEWERPCATGGSTRESGTTRKQLTRPESTASRRVGAHVVVGDAQLLEVAQEVAVQQLELVGCTILAFKVPGTGVSKCASF